MTALDELVAALPLAVPQALGPAAGNVLRHPVADPQSVKIGPLHDDAGPPGGGPLPARVVVYLGPGATFLGVADSLLKFFTQAGVTPAITRDQLAQAIVTYNQDTLPATDWRFHQVGLCLPVPIEIDGTAWVVNGDKIRALAAAFAGGWRGRLSTPPKALTVPEPAQIEGEAAALLAAPGSAADHATTLWQQVLRNPFEAVLRAFAVLHQQEAAAPAAPVATVLAALAGALPHQLAPLATTRAGTGVLRRFTQLLAGAPPGSAAARTLLNNALHQGPAGAPTPHRELPEPAGLPAVRTGVATTTAGAAADPPGGVHRLVLGRDLAVGRDDTVPVAGGTSTGPVFAGRVPFDPFLGDDAAGLNPGGTAERRGLLALMAADPAYGAPFDAVALRGAGPLTAGIAGYAATAGDGLPAVLAEFKAKAPDEFDLFFTLHGLDVGPDPADATKSKLRQIGANGVPTPMDAAALQAFLGGTTAGGAVTFAPEWAARFRLPALVSRRYRRAQVLTPLAKVKAGADAIELAVAGVNPFPARYAFPTDAAASTDLQTKVTAALEGPTGWITHEHNARRASAETLAAAVVDITDPAVVAYAGFRDTDTFYVGSMDKVAAMYAAFELRHQLRKAAAAAKLAGLNVAPAGWEVTFKAAVVKTWGPTVARGFPGLNTAMPARFPDLTAMFTFSPGGGIEFNKGGETIANINNLVGEFGNPTPAMHFYEFMECMIMDSNNGIAGRVIDAVGYPYLNGALREAGFYNPKTNVGIWLSANYAHRDWVPTVDLKALSARGARHYKPTTNLVANVAQYARMLTLVARRRMFDGDGVTSAESDEIVTIMDKNIAGANMSLVQNAVDHTPEGVGDRPVGAPALHCTKFSAKIGFGNPSPISGRVGHHECAIIERPHGATTLRYVLVFAGGFANESATYDRFIQVLDGAVAKRH